MGSGSGGSAISIHAPHTGRDPFFSSFSISASEFQSTRPIRGATILLCAALLLRYNFNPRAPYGARPVFLQFLNLRVGISIHAPHTGRDHCVLRNPGHSQRISIHAPHTGRDRRSSSSKRLSSSFQSTRPIRGATVQPNGSVSFVGVFQSTRPIRGATLWRLVIPQRSLHFNPRAPYGARLSPPDVRG